MGISNGMNRRTFLKHLVLLMFFIFIVSMLNNSFYWDSLFWQFDIVTHFLGGFWVAMFFIYVLSIYPSRVPTANMFLKVFFATLAVGVLWECYEVYIYQYLSLMPFNRTDVALDILMDLLGATSYLFYFLKIIVPASINKVQSS